MIPRYPRNSQRQLWALLGAFRRGERLTAIMALRAYEILALSQRCGDLRRLGWPIESRLIRTRSDKHVSEYWIA